MAEILNLLAPVSGCVVALADVPDPVFATRMVGDGVAIDPVDSVLRAPCAGKITFLHAAGHALTLTSDSGVPVLLHIGLDTVQLKGDGFTTRVATGERVQAGQTLIEFDSDHIARRARSLITVMLVTEPAQIKIANLKMVHGGQDVLVTIHGLVGESKTSDVGDGVTSPPVTVDLQSGLHARPAARLSQRAKTFAAEVRVVKGEQSANAKSVVGLLGLEIALGDTIRFRAQGQDAKTAAEQMHKYFLLINEEQETEETRTSNTQVHASTPGVYQGIGVATGIAVGRIHHLKARIFNIQEQSRIASADEELSLETAIATSARELQALRLGLKDPSQAAIFSAHEEILGDPDLQSQTLAAVRLGKTAAFAWNQTIHQHVTRLSALANELLAQRAHDLEDVGRRVLSHLIDDPPGVRAELEFPDQCILLAENLTPSEAAGLDRSRVLGFATTQGGATSHVSILARSLGLPAVVGLEASSLLLAEGCEVILDGDQGVLRLATSADDKRQALLQQKNEIARRSKMQSQAGEGARTRDNHKVEVHANIASVADAAAAVRAGAEGVGLLRTEFLFLERSTAPSEDEQLAVYQAIADALVGRPLTIRTLDVGGDKPLSYLQLPAEENPFLGIRGIRVGFRYPEILRQQLRAILRVKSPLPINLMFPMIADREEYRQVRAILQAEQQKLGMPMPRLGVMIEVPSAALLAETLAAEVDFFSIGTNDLTQYTLAMDRGHRELSKQIDGLHPAVLALIAGTVQAAHAHGKWVGVCGGLAGDMEAVDVLVGLGVDELSVSPTEVAQVKFQIRQTDFIEAKSLAQKALLCASAKEVRELVRSAPRGADAWL